LGVGFGGVYTALTLEQLLRHDLRRGAVELTLVNREKYRVSTRLLQEAPVEVKAIKIGSPASHGNFCLNF
jgi:NADH dehydrogenase FAD-containing subunit